MHIFAMYDECRCKVRCDTLVLGRNNKKVAQWKKLPLQIKQKKGMKK